ncbi:hypothetical protein N0824_01710 [Microcystis sp. 0824]|nr:hypothetical protein N0824_01710 [Microcystis sp. 0824]
MISSIHISIMQRRIELSDLACDLCCGLGGQTACGAISGCSCSL